MLTVEPVYPSFETRVCLPVSSICSPSGFRTSEYPKPLPLAPNSDVPTSLYASGPTAAVVKGLVCKRTYVNLHCAAAPSQALGNLQEENHIAKNAPA
jgi:hypothetical protein